MGHRLFFLLAWALAACAPGPSCPVWYPDADGDGFGGAAGAVVACTQPAGHVSDSRDCDDTNASVHPDAIEICDDADVDEDCSGAADNDDPAAIGTLSGWADVDGDGFGDDAAPMAVCDPRPGWSDVPGDCDDADPAVHPHAVELCDPENVDEDCDGLADDLDDAAEGKLQAWPDVDLDGFGDDAAAPVELCDVPPGMALIPGDCDDTRAEANPSGAEVCDPDQVDENCDGLVDDDDPTATGQVPMWPDLDGDGYADDTQPSVDLCDVPAQHSAVPGDCDDALAQVNPGQVEVCDDADLDEDCNGLSDDDDPAATGKLPFWPDADGDFYGDDLAAPVPYCDPPPGMADVDGDCDDTLPQVNPGQVEVCDDLDTDEDCNGFSDDDDPAAVGKVDAWPDADGDGYGDDTFPAAGYCDVPAGEAALPGDCEPLEPAVNPGALDPVDGLDQDCDTFDGPALLDDFEAGIPDPSVWDSLVGDWSVGPTAANGSFGMTLAGGGATITTAPLDISDCGTLAWRFMGRRGVDAPEIFDDVEISWFDGIAWRPLYTWAGGASDPWFLPIEGFLDHPVAMHSEFRIRLHYPPASGPGTDLFHLDDFTVGCAPDRDIDGVPDVLDCAPDEPLHWSDCGLCADFDLDGRGPGCDLGEDCQPANPAVHVGAPDPVGDGVDDDCSGLDGKGFFEDFEEGLVQPWKWAPLPNGISVNGANPASGTYALQLSGNAAVHLAPIDLGDCEGFGFAFMRRGTGEWYHFVEMQARVGERWVPVDTWVAEEGSWSYAPRSGGFAHPDLDTSALELRFEVNLSLVPWSLDDLRIECAHDLDGDFVIDAIDCAPDDPRHASDCGRCIDLDGDGYGPRCDLGVDCRMDDPTFHPGAADDTRDGVSQDCDVIDGPPLVSDDFESGDLDPATWAHATANVQVTVEHAARGWRSMQLGPQSASVETVAFDTSACPSVAWRIASMRGDPPPSSSASLIVEWWNGFTWSEAGRLHGDFETDAHFQAYDGTIEDPSALRQDFALRLRFDEVIWDTLWFVDALEIGCGTPDADGDGIIAAYDCDDTDPLHHSDCGICYDPDGDGYGPHCDPGGDCDSGDPSRYEGAPEVVGDGIDQDCDHFDAGAGLFDDFDTGALRPSVWSNLTGSFAVSSARSRSGDYSLHLDGNGTLESVPLDTTVCSQIMWYYHGVRTGATGSEVLNLQWWNGASWVDAYDWRVSRADEGFRTHAGLITDPAAWSTDFRMRVRIVFDGSGDVYIDDFGVGCTAGDLDGDGLLPVMDCDDLDPDRWSDCGLCVDADGDGYGSACDLGLDCDDTDPSVHLGAHDPMGDGVDTSCDGLDGTFLYDDFESGGATPGVWASLDPEIRPTRVQVGQGEVSLWMERNANHVVMTSATIDTSACSSLFWHYLGFQDTIGVSTDHLFLEYYDGAAWVGLDDWAADPVFEDRWVRRMGFVTAPSALRSGFRVRFRTDRPGLRTDFLLDQVVIGCAEDAGDGDGVPAVVDCAPNDPLHWFDCGSCVDPDNDGYGEGCDAGRDCDPANAAVNPGAVDLPGDGLDADCSGLDGTDFFDDFESGAPDARWSHQLRVAYTDGPSHSGAYALELQPNGEAITAPIDLSACSSVVWSYRGLRDELWAGDALELAWEDAGGGWVAADRWPAVDGYDSAFLLRWGEWTDPGVLRAGVRVRLWSDVAANAGLYVDDLLVGCSGGDADGDGWPAPLDCDDADPAHWLDCGLCVDADADDHGEGCDLGRDCDDADPAVNASASDTSLDGVDQDCDLADGPPLLYDGFEQPGPDPTIWATIHPAVGGVTEWAGAGAASLEIAPTDWFQEMLESVPLDTTACSVITWQYLGMNGGSRPVASSMSLRFEYWDGTTWVTRDVWDGGEADGVWRPRGGLLLDPAAYRADFRVRVKNSDGGLNGHFYIDDLTVGCASDGDGDGAPPYLDCDDADPDHWSDCGLCTDLDLDGFGPGCDRGEDCDDADPTIHPGAADLLLDGVDADCDTLDLAHMVEDFENGFGFAVGSSKVTRRPHEPCMPFSERPCGMFVAFGFDGYLSMTSTDTTGCNTVGWSYQGRRGPAESDPSSELQAWWSVDGWNWNLAHTWAGGSIDPDWVHQSGTINAPAALAPNFRFRLEVDSGPNKFSVDDVRLGCFD